MRVPTPVPRHCCGAPGLMSVVTVVLRALRCQASVDTTTTQHCGLVASGLLEKSPVSADSIYEVRFAETGRP